MFFQTNEVIFFIHLIVVLAIVLLGCRGGKSYLLVIFCVFMLIANLFAIKEIKCFGLLITYCDIYIIGAVLCLNITQEIYGKKTSRSFLYKGCCVITIFLIMSRFHVWYTPTPHCLKIDASFKDMLSYTPRMAITSLFCTFVMDRLDMRLFHFLRIKFPKLNFIFRFVGSTFFSQFFDTTLFVFLALYGVVEHPWSCIFAAYTFKVLIIACMSSFLIVAKKLIPPSEVAEGDPSLVSG